MNSPDIEDTRHVVERIHKCRAFFLEDITVIEQFGAQTVWQGVVHVFKVEGHLKTDKCYAWSSPIEGSKKRRYYTVLKIPPIDSPQKAVRAAIAYDYKKIGGGLNEKK